MLIAATRTARVLVDCLNGAGAHPAPGYVAALGLLHLRAKCCICQLYLATCFQRRWWRLAGASHALRKKKRGCELVKMPTEVRAHKPCLQHLALLQAAELEADLFGGADELIQRVAGNALDRSEGEVRLTAPPDEEQTSEDEGAEAPETVIPVSKAKPAQDKRKRAAAWTDLDTQKAEVNLEDAPKLRKLRNSESDAVLQGVYTTFSSPRRCTW